MELLEAIRTRRSIRRFKKEPVPPELIEKMLEAARWAPSSVNSQPWEFIVVTEAALRRKIADLAEYGKHIAQAPACIAVFCQDTKYYLEDGSAATQNILVAAAALGVQSCWVAGDKKDYTVDVARLVGLPPEFRLPVILADLEDLSYREIADIMECPAGTVMSRLFRGRRLLQKQLADYAAAAEPAPPQAGAEVVNLQGYLRKKQEGGAA